MGKRLMIGALVIAVSWTMMAIELRAEDANKSLDLTKENQHQTMKVLDAEWKKAFHSKDYDAAMKAVQRMEAVAPNLEGFELPKDPEKYSQFKKYSVDLAGYLALLKDAIAARDAKAVTHLTEAIQTTCNQCHTTFGGGHKHKQ